MVSSRVSTTAAAAILPLSHFGGDLDGQLLVSEESDRFTGGLNWDTQVGLVTPSEGPGMNLNRKP
jgi:hypothetical protein